MIRFVVLFALLAVPACPDKGSRLGSLQQQIRNAPFVFRGTVEKTSATTMSSVPAADNTAIVKIDEIIEAPAMPDNLTGLSITVVLEKPNSVKPKEQYVFLTRGLAYGRSIAVQEIGRREAKANDAELRQGISEAIQKNADQDLRELISRADLVVLGRVTSIEPAPEQNQRFSISEHNPQFMKAIIQVESVEKGKANNSVAVLFSSSTDVMWDDSPKLKEGQDGIWILHLNEKEGLKVEGYTALDVRDIQPRKQLDRIRRLVKAR